jgi:hypothetical protein
MGMRVLSTAYMLLCCTKAEDGRPRAQFFDGIPQMGTSHSKSWSAMAIRSAKHQQHSRKMREQGSDDEIDPGEITVNHHQNDVHVSANINEQGQSGGHTQLQYHGKLNSHTTLLSLDAEKSVNKVDCDKHSMTLYLDPTDGPAYTALVDELTMGVLVTGSPAWGCVRHSERGSPIASDAIYARVSGWVEILRNNNSPGKNTDVVVVKVPVEQAEFSDFFESLHLDFSYRPYNIEADGKSNWSAPEHRREESNQGSHFHDDGGQTLQYGHLFSLPRVSSNYGDTQRHLYDASWVLPDTKCAIVFVVLCECPCQNFCHGLICRYDFPLDKVEYHNGGATTTQVRGHQA